MKRTNKAFIGILMAGYALLMIFIVLVGVNVYQGIVTEKNLDDEFAQIEYLIDTNGITDNTIDIKLNSYVSDGDYLDVEMAIKEYLRDLLFECRRLEDVYNNSQLNMVINLYNFDEDAPYFENSKKIIDEICNRYITQNPNTTVIHLGCGLDSRCLRVDNNNISWYDIDFQSVIDLRKQFYEETEKYKMIGKSVTDLSWLDEIDLDNQSVLIVAEGLTMYLSEQELQQLIKGINSKFSNATIVFDAYSKQAVKGSKIKNPVNQMNANIKWGMNNPDDFNKLNHNLKFIKEYLIRHKENNLKGMTKFIFDNLYCGKSNCWICRRSANTVCNSPNDYRYCVRHHLYALCYQS